MQHFYEFRHARPPPVMVRVRKQPEPAQTEPMKITGGNIMKHYQKLYFKHFYAQDENGEYIPVSKKVCFAPAEEPDASNPYKQRWFYDPEAGYAVRLARTADGDKLGRRNAADLRAAERYEISKTECVLKDKNECDHDCEFCTKRNTRRTTELDKSWNKDGDGEMESRFDVADEEADIGSIMEDRELLSILLGVLDKLLPEDRELWQCMVRGDKKQDIADRFHITIDGVYYREKRLRGILRSNSALRDFFEKS